MARCQHDDHLRVPVDHINLEAIDAGLITDHPGVDPRGMLKTVDPAHGWVPVSSDESPRCS
jgi:hypothetical protein